MKIIAIGRNYAEHAKELNNPVPAIPVIFMKPDTALLKDNKPFYHPDFSDDIHHEIELVLKISKEGKHVSEKFAGNYFEEIGLGIDFTARDIQQRHKEKGLPWELAKSFDNSAPISTFVPKTQFSDLYDINFRLDVNGETRQSDPAEAPRAGRP
ncbi:MAG: FAA hydrolase family protein [Chitinophagaceae bacterium]|nr:MAG: FAA hydrolase family protein [Chitinophagaceae bacterium]